MNAIYSSVACPNHIHHRSSVKDSLRQPQLSTAAKLALKASALDDARAYGQEMLHSARSARNWNHGNLIFYGNMVLGQIALRGGEKESAKTFLLASGKTPGSPQLNSFGPNMALAKELLAAGEKETNGLPAESGAFCRFRLHRPLTGS